MSFYTKPAYRGISVGSLIAALFVTCNFNNKSYTIGMDSKLKTLIELLFEGNLKIVELMSEPDISKRAILYTMAGTISDQFLDIFKALGKIEDHEARIKAIKDFREKIKLEDLATEVEIAEKEMLGILKKDSDSSKLLATNEPKALDELQKEVYDWQKKSKDIPEA